MNMKHSGGYSKAKGSAFELAVVKLIRKAVKRKFPSESICYRTPRSGGHYIIGGADIIIGPELRKIFPFAVECKHRKTIKLHKLFKVSKETKEFLKQSIENTYESDDYPLLVIRGTRTPIFCASTIDALKSSGYEVLSTPHIPGLVFKYRSKTWKIFLFSFFIKELSNKV